MRSRPSRGIPLKSGPCTPANRVVLQRTRLRHSSTRQWKQMRRAGPQIVCAHLRAGFNLPDRGCLQPQPGRFPMTANMITPLRQRMIEEVVERTAELRSRARVYASSSVITDWPATASEKSLLGGLCRRRGEEEIKNKFLQDAWSTKRKAGVHWFGSTRLGASVLLISELFFGDSGSQRFVATAGQPGATLDRRTCMMRCRGSGQGWNAGVAFDLLSVI